MVLPAGAASHPFRGLVSYVLTPTRAGRLDEAALERLVVRAVTAGSDAVAVLGSTGNALYHPRGARAAAVRRAVAAAGTTPVVAGVSALSVRDVREHVADAQAAGAAGLLLAAVTYQPLGDQEVVGLYEAVVPDLSAPLAVYDNPGTTHVRFTDAMLAQATALPGVVAVKVPPPASGEARERLVALRGVLPAGTGIGVSGDWAAAEGLSAGADAWHSAVGGTLPVLARTLVDAVGAGPQAQTEVSVRLEPLWALVRRHGSLRVAAAAAQVLGLTSEAAVVAPVHPLGRAAHEDVARALEGLDDLVR